MNLQLEETFLDYPSPDDSAVILFLPGCSHSCLGCQNPKLQELHEEWTYEEEQEILQNLQRLCFRCDTNKIVLSGGDPLSPCNRNLTIRICELLGKNPVYKYDICIYTGYDIEEVKKMELSGFEFIKCGKFDAHSMRESKKTDEYIQFVNETQNLFDKNFNQISKNGRYYFTK